MTKILHEPMISQNISLTSQIFSPTQEEEEVGARLWIQIFLHLFLVNALRFTSFGVRTKKLYPFS